MHLLSWSSGVRKTCRGLSFYTYEIILICGSRSTHPRSSSYITKLFRNYGVDVSLNQLLATDAGCGVSDVVCLHV